MDIKVVFFKDTGKYYTEETLSIPSHIDQVEDVKDWIIANMHGYKGMYVTAMLDELPNGYPILITPDQRR